MKGWRIASMKWDSMNGDYTKVCVHSFISCQYFLFLLSGFSFLIFMNDRIFTYQLSLIPILQVDLHTKYYENARLLLSDISPAHSQNMIHTLIEKLENLAESASEVLLEFMFSRSVSTTWLDFTLRSCTHSFDEGSIICF